MARASADMLDAGDAFPSLTFDTVDHGALHLPDAWRDRWGVLLVYRAHW